MYQGEVHSKLINREWFKKVDALEQFTDYWSFGRGMNSMPSHNIYVPVSHTIMPRPKLFDTSKDDQSGAAFSMKSSTNHSP